MAQLAVGQRQRLLRHDAFGALVTIGRIGRIKQFGEHHLGLRRVMEINRTLMRLFTLRFVQIRAAHGRIQLPGQKQYTIPHHFGFHAARVHTPEIFVFRINGKIGISRIAGGRLHAIRAAGDD